MGIPISHLLSRVANDYTLLQDSFPPGLRTLLVRVGIAEDWSQSELETTFPSIVEWNGQGASPTRSNKSPVFSGRQPLVSEIGGFDPIKPEQIHYVDDEKGLLQAIRNARPGDVLQLQPGRYFLKGRSISVTSPGRSEAPIIVRAAKLGTVSLEMDMLEGFHLLAPFWVFENLDIQGVCQRDARCEHAFHIVKGGSFILRNNRITDFNASIKVNGLASQDARMHPDYGLIENNTLANSRPRDTDNPVTLVDIVAANKWTVRGNLIADFAKGKGNQISYGAFMKGGGSDGVFENNLVICEMKLPPDRGLRIGLSFGGGGTSNLACRENQCFTEFFNGIMRNNVVLNCSRDVGMYLNRAKNARIHNNLLHRTLGIDVRFDTSSTVIYNNIISGRIRLRDQGVVLLSHNLVDHHCFNPDGGIQQCEHADWYEYLDGANLKLKHGGKLLKQGLLDAEYEADFCGNPPLNGVIDMGPIQYSAKSDCNPLHMNATSK